MSTGEPPAGPQEGVPRTTETGPITGRTRSRDTWFGPDAPSRRFLSRWGLPLFVVIMLVLGRAVLLPFVFAGLIAYVLAPIVQRMSERKNGTRRMPRGLAIIMCYIVFLAAVTGFMFLLVPRLSRDVARLAKEAGPTAQRIDKQYVPSVARWLEERFPSLKVVKAPQDDQPIVRDIQPPPVAGCP